MKRYLLSGLALASLAAWAQQAASIPESAYRKGEPEVLTPVPAAPINAAPKFDSTVFKTAYQRAGQPTMVVLWNREFSDMMQQSTASQLNINNVRAGVAAGETIRLPGQTATQVSAAAISNTTISTQDVKTQQASRNVPVERIDLQVRSAFMQTIVSAGVKLVDRNIIMRTSAAKQKGANLDSQQVETEAFVKHSKLLMEVLNTRDAASPTGWATYVSIKRLADGVVLAEGYMDGSVTEEAVKPPPKFEADARGGFREVAVAAKPINIADVGTRAAQQTLIRLGEALTR
jgi:hypothetical protein